MSQKPFPASLSAYSVRTLGLIGMPLLITVKARAFKDCTNGVSFEVGPPGTAALVHVVQEVAPETYSVVRRSLVRGIRLETHANEGVPAEQLGEALLRVATVSPSS